MEKEVIGIMTKKIVTIGPHDRLHLDYMMNVDLCGTTVTSIKSIDVYHDNDWNIVMEYEE